MTKMAWVLALTASVTACSSFNEDQFHKLLDDADELAKECSVYEREVACNKTINRITRLTDYMLSNQNGTKEHFKEHPYDEKVLNRIFDSVNKL